MKVFNWMHRKLLNVHTNNTLTKEDGKRSPKKMDFERRALLENEGHDNEVDNWKNGILAIGTLGIGLFDGNIQNQTSDDQITKDLAPHDDHDPDHHEYDLVDDHHPDQDHAMFFEQVVELLENLGSGCKEIEEVVEETDHQVHELMKDNNESKEKEKFDHQDVTVKRRVTLADLFSEDSDHYNHHDDDHVHFLKQVEDDDDCAKESTVTLDRKPSNKLKMKKFTTFSAKNGFAKAKKLLKDYFRPFDLLNQLMKRMTKKKIHPDMEAGKVQKDIQMQPRSSTDVEVGPHESPSLLLPIQDAMV